MNDQAGGGLQISAVNFSRRAERDLKKLDHNQRAQASEAFEALFKSPMPAWIRFKKFSHGNCFTIHITHDGSYKAAIDIEGSRATVIRVGTHQALDNSL